MHVQHLGAAYPVVADPAYYTNCGWISCTDYMTRSWTKEINGVRANSRLNQMRDACWITGVTGVPGAIVSVVCNWGFGRLQDQFNEGLTSAVRNNGCPTMQYRRFVGRWDILGFGWTNNGYCRTW